MNLIDVVQAVEKLVPAIAAEVKADMAIIADEPAARTYVKVKVQDELTKIAPIPVIEAFVNAALPGVLKIATPIVGAVENAMIPKIEVDAVGLVTNLIFNLLDKELGADWFAKAKAAI